MEYIKVLYNNCHGGFGFSEQFVLEFVKRTGKPLIYSHQHMNIRDNPEAIKLFEEKGSEWCSESYSSIECQIVPMFLKEYWNVHEYDGKETIVINFSYAIESVLDEYLKNPTEKLEWLKEQVIKIKSSRDNWNGGSS